MDESESPSSNGMQELREEVRSLRTLLSASLILLIVFSLCLDAYWLKQTSMLGGQATQAEKNLGNFNVKKASDVWLMLNEYARTHPEFAPIVQKYHQFVPMTVLVPGAQNTRK